MEIEKKTLKKKKIDLQQNNKTNFKTKLKQDDTLVDKYI